MKYIFLINPLAGGENSVDKIRGEVEKLSNASDCEIHVTTGVGDAITFVTDWCNTHTEDARFIACGGDGTLNEVTNGVMNVLDSKKDQEVPHYSISCYPCGSGNDFVKVYGGAERFRSVEKLIAAEEDEIDLLSVGGRYSINIVNFGFDTDVAIQVGKLREKTGKGGAGHYVKGVIHALRYAMLNHFTVTSDGEVLNPEGVALLCSVANGQYVGGMFQCAPKADVHDGLMEVCMFRPISRLMFLKFVGPFAKGQHLDMPKLQNKLVYRRAKKVVIDAEPGFAYSLDGEIIESTHFEVEIVPKALKFAVPKQ